MQDRKMEDDIWGKVRRWKMRWVYWGHEVLPGLSLCHIVRL